VPRSINELGDAAALRLIPAKSIPKKAWPAKRLLR
jgi:hypothetical protein